MPRALQATSTKARLRRKVVKSKRRKSSNGDRGSVSLFSFFLLMLIMGFFSFYLYLNVQLVELNFDLKERDVKIESLEAGIQKVESRIGNSLSIEDLRSVANNLNLVDVENVRYLEPGSVPSASLQGDLKD